MTYVIGGFKIIKIFLFPLNEPFSIRDFLKDVNRHHFSNLSFVLYL